MTIAVSALVMVQSYQREGRHYKGGNAVHRKTIGPIIYKSKSPIIDERLTRPGSLDEITYLYFELLSPPYPSHDLNY